MATKSQKLEALKRAIEIAKESARGGNSTPDEKIDRCYKKIVEIYEQIDQGDN